MDVDYKKLYEDTELMRQTEAHKNELMQKIVEERDETIKNLSNMLEDTTEDNKRRHEKNIEKIKDILMEVHNRGDIIVAMEMERLEKRLRRIDI